MAGDLVFTLGRSGTLGDVVVEVNICFKFLKFCYGCLSFVQDLTYYDPRAVYQEHLITYNLIKPTRNLLEPTADRFHFISGPSSNTRGQKAAKRLLQYDPAAYTTASTHQRKMTKKETIKKNQAVLASKRQELLASKSNATDFNQILEQLHFNARSDLKGVASEEVIEKWTASEQGYLSDLRNNTVEPTKNQKVFVVIFLLHKKYKTHCQKIILVMLALINYV